MSWQPCCAVRAPKAKALLTAEEREEIAQALRDGAPRHLITAGTHLYAIGPWASMDVSPTMWAHGAGHSLPFYVVRDVAIRMRRIRAATKVPGYMPGRGIFPKAWAALGGGGGLVDVEARWAEDLMTRLGSAAAAAGPSTSAAAARDGRQFTHSWQPPPWMRTSFRLGAQEQAVAADQDNSADFTPPSLDHGDGPRTRAGGRAAPAPSQDAQGLRPPARPDHFDVALAPPGTVPNPARKAWDRLSSRRIPRDLRAIGWRLLHAALYTGVFRAHVRPTADPTTAFCSAPACQDAQTMETAEHLFLTCPSVAPAADWLCRLWAAVAGPGSAAPPCTVAVLLADDDRTWRPGGSEEQQELWTTLRLSWLHSVWTLRCRRLREPLGPAITPAGIVGVVVANVKRLIRRDFTRTICDARNMTAAPSSWFRGPVVPTLAPDAFLTRWAGHGNALCSVGTTTGASQSRRLVLHLSSSSPVALQ